MRMLAEIMKRTEGFSAWWLDPVSDKIISGAHRLGLVYRPSTSQVEWTEKGIRLYHKYI